MADCVRQCLKIALALTASIFVTQWLHELGHALGAKALGYDVVMSSNSVVADGQGFSRGFDAIFITAAGPAATFLIAGLAYFYRAQLGWLAPVILFNTMTMRMLAAVVSIGSPNDEAKISLGLGLGYWTLPILVCLAMIVPFALVAREHRLDWRWYLAAWLGMSIGYTIVVLGEPLLPSFQF